MQSTVNTAIQLSKALAETLRTAIGAAVFRPIAITTAPVTTGGIRRSIQRVPIFITTRPIRGVDQPAGDDPAKGDAQMRVQPGPLKPVMAITTPTKAALEPR